MTDLLTIIYAPEEENLLPFWGMATHWLPENSDDTADIYQLRNVVCTTKYSILEMLKVLIIEGILPYDQIIWIDVTNHRDRTAYTFNAIGEINDFFGI